MKLKDIIVLTGLVLLITAPNLSFCQYLNKLYDADSTYDWGWNIFLRPDNSFFLLNAAQNTKSQAQPNSMVISADGNTMIYNKTLKIDSVSIYQGNYGQAKECSAGYITPITVEKYSVKKGGILKYNTTGDSLFLKTYTDTSLCYDIMNTCAVLQNGQAYLIGGERKELFPVEYPSVLQKTDTNGNLLWTHTYQKDTTQWTAITNIIPLSDGRFVIGAHSAYWANPSWTYGHYTPWFLVLDSVGNIIRDTLYGAKYAGGGGVCQDTIGGYVHYGQIDSLVISNPSHLENFPDYIAHLDTNFRMEWITRFQYSVDSGHRHFAKVIQLSDGNFLIAGEAARDIFYPTYNVRFQGWAAKVSRDGNVLWNHFYWSDSLKDAHFTDVIEKPDRHLVFIGASIHDSLPSWHHIQDVWLVETDSDGCEVPGCNVIITQVNSSPVSAAGKLSVYPNPNSGFFTVKLSSPDNEPAEVVITDVTGRLMKTQAIVTNDEADITLHASSGVYFITASTTAGKWVQKILIE